MDRANGIANKCKLLLQLSVTGNQSSAHRGVMTFNELGGRMQHHVRAEIEWTLERRREQSVIDYQQRVRLFGQTRSHLNVRQL